MEIPRSPEVVANSTAYFEGYEPKKIECTECHRLFKTNAAYFSHRRMHRWREEPSCLDETMKVACRSVGWAMHDETGRFARKEPRG